VVVDAKLFVPQSRPRLFVVGVHEDAQLPEGLMAEGPLTLWHTRTLRTAYEKLCSRVDGHPGEDRVMRLYHGAGGWLEREVEKDLLFGRMLKTDEVAGAIAFHTSEESGMMTTRSLTLTSLFLHPTSQLG
jgi:site-specific DNA-cytosine methylase